jgi:hypothetical protein
MYIPLAADGFSRSEKRKRGGLARRPILRPPLARSVNYFPAGFIESIRIKSFLIAYPIFLTEYFIFLMKN